MEVDTKDHDRKAQDSSSENWSIGYRSIPIKRKEARHSNEWNGRKVEKKEARNSSASDGAGS